MIHHPEAFFDGQFESVEELERGGERARAVAAGLVARGELVQDAAGRRLHALRRMPHRDVHPRGAGPPWTIVEQGSGKLLGRIDAVRVWRECHPGAVYLHAGRSWRVLRLDGERSRAVVREHREDSYTVVLGEKETRILERLERGRLGPHPLGYGRLAVTVRIRGYQKRRLFGGEPLSEHPLDAPPQTWETTGFWLQLPPDLPAAFAADERHFMGGIHAVEHAMIALFPLLAIADRGDVGGISYTGHPQLGSPAIFIYDGVPGGAALAEQGFVDARGLCRRTLEQIATCACAAGCPGCIQSPSCGNGNKPLDKLAARRVLELVLGLAPLEHAPAVEPETIEATDVPEPPRGSLPAGRHGIRRAGNVENTATETAPALLPPPGSREATAERLLILDVETQRGAAEVGGWNRTDRMGLALAVVYDVSRRSYRTYFEADVHRLLLDLVMADRVVGFNIDRFDLGVLGGYTEWDLGRVRTLDMLAVLRGYLGFGVSLNHLAEVNLGRAKAGGGLQALEWWKAGRLDLIEHYCRQDVEMTWRLWQLGREQGYLLCRDRAERTVRAQVRF